MHLSILLLTLTAQAGTSTSADEVIVVTGARTKDAIGALPYSTTALGEREIANGRPTLSLGESLSQVPGVFVAAQSNYSQDTRISIRGFGARAPFGVRGIRLFLDGIPLTLPDGQSQIDSLDLANIDRMEILRGPAASLYGNAAGGVLYLETKDPGPVPEAEVFNMVGAFETWKLAASGRARVGETGVSLFASRTQTDGFREQSGTEQVVAQARTVSQLADNVRLSAIIHWFDSPRADDPGGLTPEQFRATPSAAAAVNERFGTGEAVSQLQAGTRLVASSDDARHRVEATVHAGLRDFSNAIPFRTVAFSRDFYGGLLVYRWEEEDWLSGHRLALGAELQGQEDRRDNQGNRDGQPDGEVQLLQTEAADSLGLFAQERLSIFEPLAALGSVRYDRVELSVQDDFLEDGDASGRRTFEQVTAQGGLLGTVTRGLELYGNVSQSFETPTLSELVNASPEGGLSQTLDPQKALSVEAGARLRNRWVRAEATGFYIDLEDELIAREDELNRTIFVNAGASRRVGAEASLRLGPVRGADLTVAYTFLRSTFEDDGPGEASRRGNLIPGLPEHRLFARLRYDDGRLFGAFDLEWVGTRFADDANEVSAPAHTLADLRVGTRFALSRQLGGELNLGIRNLFDVDYVENVRANAFGGRSFEPGPPLHVYGALSLRFAGE
jgi:iron complex outermembrane receptor protein